MNFNHTRWLLHFINSPYSYKLATLQFLMYSLVHDYVAWICAQNIWTCPTSTTNGGTMICSPLCALPDWQIGICHSGIATVSLIITAFALNFSKKLNRLVVNDSKSIAQNDDFILILILTCIHHWNCCRQWSLNFENLCAISVLYINYRLSDYQLHPFTIVRCF